MSNKLYSVTTAEFAKLAKVNVSTVRKWARARKIAYQTTVNGFLFNSGDVNDFVRARMYGHGPLSPAGQPAFVQQQVNKTKVIIVVDVSGSMSPWIAEMEQLVNAQIKTFASMSDAHNLYDISIVTFSNRPGIVGPFYDSRVAKCPLLCTGGFTALNDTITNALAQATKTLNVSTDAVLINVFTDGDNNIGNTNDFLVGNAIGLSVATDRVTFVFNCPNGKSNYIVNRYRVPAGNVREWETSHAGFENLKSATVSATNLYATTRSTGVTSSRSYYANLSGDTAQVAQKIDNILDDVTKSVDVQHVMNVDPQKISDFAKKKFGHFNKGSVFYQLMKSETVQPYKEIIIQDTATGKFYKGRNSARGLLSVPVNLAGDIKLSPGKLGAFKVFVQSTSVNRKLKPGSVVVNLK